MAKTFLQIAEIILREIKKPLTPQDIYIKAEEKRLINSTGKTPELSMKARISTDIRNNGFNSKFMRVGPNRFALREFGLKEHISQPFKKSIPNEIITCIGHDKLELIKSNFGLFTELGDLFTIIDDKNLTYLKRKDAENSMKYKQLISYVLLTNERDEVLTYRRGSYTNAHEMLKGSVCLGFGGHVQSLDSTGLFTNGYAGVFDTAEREVFEELKGIRPNNLEIIGYINEDSSPEGVKHLGIILKGKIPKKFDINSVGKELSVNGLKFMTPNELYDHFYEFEFWSQLVIKHFYNVPDNYNPVVIRPRKFNINSNIILFVGEIATGKTIICELLSERLGFHYVSTRKCVAKLIEMRDFGTNDRTQFQKHAERFITAKDGPFILAQEIKKEVEKSSDITVVDGIRQLATLKELKKIYPELTLIYVDSSRDDSFRNYSIRSKGKANLDQFREVRFHPVEKEIRLIKWEADAYIFNGGDRDQLFETFIDWFKTNKK